MPTISCIMPVYNTANYLDECIQSILNQSFTDFEFIISDDGSTDGSKKIIKKYKDLDSRIIFLNNKKNRGICDNLNDCIHLAKGEFIAIMESDDISCKDRFSNYIDNLNNIDLLGGSAEYIDEKGNTIIKKVDGIYSNEKIQKTYIKTLGIITPSFIFRKNIIAKIGYLENKNIWDYELYVKAAINGFKIKNLDKVLIKKRIHNESEYNKKFKKINKIILNFRKKIVKENKLGKFKYIEIYIEYIKLEIINFIKSILMNLKIYNFIYSKIRGRN